MSKFLSILVLLVFNSYLGYSKPIDQEIYAENVSYVIENRLHKNSEYIVENSLHENFEKYFVILVKN